MAKKTLSKKVAEINDNEVLETQFVCVCPTCEKKGKPQPLHKFYNTNSEISDKYPVCKECIKKMIDIDNMSTVYNVLREMNIAFVDSLWATAIIKNPNNPFGKYITLMNSGFGYYKGMCFDEKQIKETKFEEIINRKLKKEKEDISKRRVSPEIVEFWGDGFSDEEYIQMQKKYDFLKESYPLQSNIHIENLKAYVMPTIKAEMALAHDDFVGHKQWHSLSMQASDRAKLSVKQLSKSDLQGGIDSFSELCQAVEQAKDVISVLPKVRYRPNDSADFIIWQEINYVRNMLGMDFVPYEDIYKFYEDMKNKYIEDKGDPFGIFKDDPTEKNREIIKNFIKEDDEEDDDSE